MLGVSFSCALAAIGVQVVGYSVQVQGGMWTCRSRGDRPDELPGDGKPEGGRICRYETFWLPRS